MRCPSSNRALVSGFEGVGSRRVGCSGGGGEEGRGRKGGGELKGLWPGGLQGKCHPCGAAAK
jgi:hypothetical protein